MNPKGDRWGMKSKMISIMKNLIHLPAASIGSPGYQISLTTASMEVMGNTSKGYFLKHPGNQIVFLSKEAYRGPYTITLEDPDTIMELTVETAWIEPGRLILNQKYQVDFIDCIPWLPQKLVTTIEIQPSTNEIKRLSESAELAQKTDAPIRLLRNVFFTDTIYETPDEHWAPVVHAIRQHNYQALVERLQGVVGYGRGLTPSGDDFILGMLLGLARYSDYIRLPEKDLSDFDQIILFAREKTTLISVNLMLGAQIGQADERLIQAFDGFMAGSLTGRNIYDILSTWGNSSGLDAFTGWVMLLYCLGKI
jgi:hypothetical protein